MTKTWRIRPSCAVIRMAECTRFPVHSFHLDAAFQRALLRPRLIIGFHVVNAKANNLFNHIEINVG